MKRIHFCILIVLIFSFLNLFSIAKSKIIYKTYNKLPCKFNGAKVTATASPDSWKPAGKSPCLNNKKKGYSGKMGTSIEVKRGTPVFAVKNMELIIATDYSSEFSCIISNSSQIRHKGEKTKVLINPLTGKKITCRYPFDGLSLTFKTQDDDMVLYYHLMPKTPLVPGFGKGKCKIRKFYQIDVPGQRLSRSVDEKICGGIKKRKVKKGEIIGYVGHATNDHISFNISPKQKGFLNSPESKKHNLLWESYPKNPKAFLLPIMPKKYVENIEKK